MIRRGYKVEMIEQITGVDKWFINKFKWIVEQEEKLKGMKIEDLNKEYKYLFGENEEIEKLEHVHNFVEGKCECGETTEVLVESIKIAGDDFDEAMVRYMRKKHNLLIGERTAEELKIRIGTAFKRPEVEYMDVKGRNLVTGLPKVVKVSSEETEEALRETTSQIVETIHSVLEKTPPELAADISDKGIYMTGGGCLVDGLDKLLQEKTGINVMIFTLLHFPCGTTLLTIKKEAGGWKWAVVAFLLPTICGIALCMITTLFWNVFVV